MSRWRYARSCTFKMLVRKVTDFGHISPHPLRGGRYRQAIKPKIIDFFGSNLVFSCDQPLLTKLIQSNERNVRLKAVWYCF